MNKILITIIFLITTTELIANNSPIPADVSTGFVYGQEHSDIGYIVSLGAQMTVAEKKTGLGVQFATTLSSADVIDFSGYEESYVAWEGSMKYGIFSTFSLYVEAGVDIGETIFRDFHDYGADVIVVDGNRTIVVENDNSIDYFLGAGLGIQKGPFKIDGIVRYRDISGFQFLRTDDVFT
ncbi:MAG: hypothetical protein V2I33_15680, partial [Kangiellaceae bacterium]|nr:hypothetical protein [Kangiellaceae bacterium]